jgi:hypothetical protein
MCPFTDFATLEQKTQIINIPLVTDMLNLNTKIFTSPSKVIVLPTYNSKEGNTVQFTAHS